jgi:hypothetical protein
MFGAAVLEMEARYLHRAFFHRDPAPEVVQRYVEANVHCFGVDASASPLVKVLVERKMDAEAVEYALRVRHAHLFHRIDDQLLRYIVETRADYYADFVNDTACTSKAAFVLILSIPKAAYKFLKGSLLCWRHGFA